MAEIGDFESRVVVRTAIFRLPENILWRENLNANDETTDVERNSDLSYSGNESRDFKGRKAEILSVSTLNKDVRFP